MEDKDFVKASSRWLLEMNLLNNDYVKAALLTNIYVLSSSIKDVELLVDQHNKRMLIYIEFSFFGRLFQNKSKLSSNVEMLIKDALPNYELRVIYDKVLFEKAIMLLNPEPSVSKETPETETPQEEDTDKKEA